MGLYRQKAVADVGGGVEGIKIAIFCHVTNVNNIIRSFELGCCIPVRSRILRPAMGSLSGPLLRL